jgi:valyl-tRNA synthetase
MFGDTAVAVAPGDERYKDIVGKELVLATCWSSYSNY